MFSLSGICCKGSPLPVKIVLKFLVLQLQNLILEKCKNIEYH